MGFINRAQRFIGSNYLDVDSPLDQGKARNPEGLSAELFQNKVIGESLKQSLLIMLNEIKQEGKEPYFMNVPSVTTIPIAGSNFMLTNKRAIFIVSILNTILLILLYDCNYSMGNNSTYDSNIGARRGKSCRNCLLISMKKKNMIITLKITALRFNNY